MASNQSMAEADAATEALILQLIAQDLGVVHHILPATSSHTLPEESQEPDTQSNPQTDQSGQGENPESDASNLNNNHNEVDSAQPPHSDNLDIEKMPKRTRDTAGLEPSSSPTRRRLSSAIDGTSLAIRGQHAGGATGTGVLEHGDLNDDVPASGNTENTRAEATNEPPRSRESPSGLSFSGSHDNVEWPQTAAPTTAWEAPDSWGSADAQEDAGWGDLPEPTGMGVLDHTQNDTENPADNNNADATAPEAPDGSDEEESMYDSGDSANGSESSSENQHGSNPNESDFEERANTTSHPHTNSNIPFFEIPWPGVPGWIESYVYESFNDPDAGDGYHRRGGPTREQMRDNQRRMQEEEPVDIVLEEFETLDWQLEKMIEREEREEVEARRKAKGKGRATD